MNWETLDLLARAEGVAIGAIIGETPADGRPGSAPLAFHAGLREHVDQPEIPIEQWEWLQCKAKWGQFPGLVAAVIGDDHFASRYQPGDVVFAVPLAELGHGLIPGREVLIKRFMHHRTDGAVREVLVMRIGPWSPEAIHFYAIGQGRRITESLNLMRGSAASAGFADQEWSFEQPSPAEIDYHPEPDDDLEVIGEIVGEIRARRAAQ